ncbi:unnamed protein product [Symbiodinium natans]|uniref:PDZ domain-containing protein n=1 Tax=Symbiodinium natans TaxID=878477 RepID=A0A812JLS2_9DINO|nr:unnamed protein product [Symbiodinium natans]
MDLGVLLLLLHGVFARCQIIEGPAPEIELEIRMTDAVRDAFSALFDETFMQQMVDCQQLAGDNCDVTGLAEYMIEVGARLQNSISQCPMGCSHSQQLCKDFWLAFESNPVALRNGCAMTNNWPGVCTTFLRELQKRVADDTWELSVMCRMIDAGLNLERMPDCKTLAVMTTASRPTLHDGGCSFETREECISNLCDVYSQFAWRMRPRNLIPEQVKVPFDYSYILSGCEHLVDLDMYNRRDECHDRLDILAFCDCLCPGMSLVNVLGITDCPAVVDNYLMFGRLGIANTSFDALCEPEICEAFSSRRLTAACRDTRLPGDDECLALQLPKVLPQNSPCPWLNHSNEENILECLDGHRCDIDAEGWYCCENHRGRAKCPAQFPVMCDTLCSGITEYCCREEGQCTPRGCPVVLQRDLVYRVETTTETSTTPEGRAAVEEEGFNLRLPEGSWVWLLLLVPCSCGLVLVVYVRRLNKKFESEQVGEGETDLGLKLDKFGFFHAYKAENVERETNKPRVCIIMSELPDSRPLGLELLELRVVRVHPWGAKHGWQVGDIIVDIAGQPVSSFEQLWERIQVERNRPPVRFTVERWNVQTTAEEEAALNLQDPDLQIKMMKKQVEEDHRLFAEHRSKSRIAASSKQIPPSATPRPDREQGAFTSMSANDPARVDTAAFPRTLGPNVQVSALRSSRYRRGIVSHLGSFVPSSHSAPNCEKCVARTVPMDPPRVAWPLASREYALTRGSSTAAQ